MKVGQTNMAAANTKPLRKAGIAVAGLTAQRGEDNKSQWPASSAAGRVETGAARQAGSGAAGRVEAGVARQAESSAAWQGGNNTAAPLTQNTKAAGPLLVVPAVQQSHTPAQCGGPGITVDYAEAEGGVVAPGAAAARRACTTAAGPGHCSAVSAGGSTADTGVTSLQPENKPQHDTLGATLVVDTEIEQGSSNTESGGLDGGLDGGQESGDGRYSRVDTA